MFVLVHGLFMAKQSKDSLLKHLALTKSVFNGLIMLMKELNDGELQVATNLLHL